jgi:hypothetical protein
VTVLGQPSTQTGGLGTGSGPRPPPSFPLPASSAGGGEALAACPAAVSSCDSRRGQLGVAPTPKPSRHHGPNGWGGEGGLHHRHSSRAHFIHASWEQGTGAQQPLNNKQSLLASLWPSLRPHLKNHRRGQVPQTQEEGGRGQA